MGEPAEAIAVSKQENSNNLADVLSTRLSKELVISLCGPVGCGIKDIQRIVQEGFEQASYKVIHIKISDLIRREIKSTDALSDLKNRLPPESAGRADQIQKMQDLGNQLRKRYGNDVCSELAIREIAVWRQRQAKDDSPDKIAITQSTVFLIDQLKHPAESELLQTVYGNIYYQIGILSSDDEKVNTLVKDHIERAVAVQLIETDRRENDKKYGQQLEKTLAYSDYFISNIAQNLTSLKDRVNRFINLVHGKNGITPTFDEVGMNAAYTAGLRSACLSRQVGAAICDDKGNVLSVGRNDVPKFGGGLYTTDDGENDRRCVNYGAKCYNTEHINKLKDDIKRILVPHISDQKDIDNVIESIEKNTLIGSLLEFSRAIHAEMDAITALARNNNCSTHNATIYTTTYPCHNCARHIIAAGIKRVVYIEPYAKSLATKLHGDAIKHDSFPGNYVNVVSFEGVAPRRHQGFFAARSSRKDGEGRALAYSKLDRSHVDAVLVSKYTETEEKVAQIITDRLKESPQIAVSREG